MVLHYPIMCSVTYPRVFPGFVRQELFYPHLDQYTLPCTTKWPKCNCIWPCKACIKHCFFRAVEFGTLFCPESLCAGMCLFDVYNLPVVGMEISTAVKLPLSLVWVYKETHLKQSPTSPSVSVGRSCTWPPTILRQSKFFQLYGNQATPLSFSHLSSVTADTFSYTELNGLKCSFQGWT